MDFETKRSNMDVPTTTYMVTASFAIGIAFFSACVIFLNLIFAKKKPAKAKIDATTTSSIQKQPKLIKNEETVEVPVQKPTKELHQRKKKKTRHTKQEFKHPLLYSTLKCVKGEICDMDFSNNGKYLATCSTADTSSDSGASVGDREEEEPPKPTTVLKLSRRQKKNRKKPLCVPKDGMVPIMNWLEFGDERDLFEQFELYVLNDYDRFALGHPMQVPDAPGFVYIYKHPKTKVGRTQMNSNQNLNINFNLNACEFVPNSTFTNSTSFFDSSPSITPSSSGNSSDDDEDIVRRLSGIHYFKYPKVPFTEMRNVMRYLPKTVSKVQSRSCIRCNKRFYCDLDNKVMKNDECCYHPGRYVQTPTYKRSVNTSDGNWSCCYKSGSEPGCRIHHQHVWTGVVEGYNGPYADYVKTKKFRSAKKHYNVFALDCEMSFTNDGLDLTHISIVDIRGKVVYTTYVLPDAPIVDYNTQFSGVSETHLNNKQSSVKSLRQVQNDILSFIDADSILIGHGLENDLRALKIIHKKVVDTSALYPHLKGFPFRQSLKNLSMRHLNLTIQNDMNGHNPGIDAYVSMQLAVLKVLIDMGLYTN